MSAQHGPDPLASWETERALLAALFVAPVGAVTLRGLIAGGALRAEHFTDATHGALFRALASTALTGGAVDEPLLIAALSDGGAVADPRRLVFDLAATAFEEGNVERYARRLRELSARRRLRDAAERLLRAARSGDEQLRAEALAAVAEPASHATATATPAQLARDFAVRLDRPDPAVFRFPWPQLDARTRGGLRRKQVMAIGGWSGMGKSVAYDEILAAFAAQGHRVHSYINEMSAEERVDRAIARLSGVPYEAIDGGAAARDPERRRVLAAARALGADGFGITECAGWSAEEIAQHALVNRWDVIGVDIVHEIAHRDERELAAIAQTLRAAAKQADAALLMCVHLNDQRVVGARRPLPVARDIRGTGMIHRCADVVLFVHRHDDEDGVPGLDGVFKLDKLRRGRPGAFATRFEPERMRWREREQERAEAAA